MVYMVLSNACVIVLEGTLRVLRIHTFHVEQPKLGMNNSIMTEHSSLHTLNHTHHYYKNLQNRRHVYGHMITYSLLHMRSQ